MQFEYDPENLIREVKKRPGLWDFNHRQYRTKNVRMKLWTEVVKALTAEDTPINKSEMRELELQLQKKWKSIRDYHHRFIRNPKKGGRKYMYFDQLDFLLKNEKNLPNQEEDSSDSEDNTKRAAPSAWKPVKKIKLKRDTEEEKVESSEDNQPDNDDADSFEVPIESSQFRSNQNETSHFAFANVDPEPNTPGSSDPEKLFLLSLLPHLKSIPKQFRLNVQMELMQVLQNAKFSINQNT